MIVIWVKNPTVLSKQCKLRPDVSYNRSELFHFCMFTCSHASSVKKVDVQNRNTFTYIRWRCFKSRITNIRFSSSFLQWKEHNEFHLSFCNGFGIHIFHVAVGILREVGALVEKKSIVESRKFIRIIFFVSYHAIKLKVNGLN